MIEKEGKQPTCSSTFCSGAPDTDICDEYSSKERSGEMSCGEATDVGGGEDEGGVGDKGWLAGKTSGECSE